MMQEERSTTNNLSAFSEEELYTELIRRKSALVNRISVSTPEGNILACVMPDEDNPGIALLYTKEGSGEPGAVMEYISSGSQAGCVQLQVWTKEKAQDDPEYTLQMS